MATDWEAVARRAAAAHGINEDYFANQIRAESNFNPNARSPAGATGIAQIMPGTAKGWGVDPNDPNAALNAAAKAMAKYLGNYKGDWRKALSAYNAGPGAVQKYGGVPPYAETKNYIKKILGASNPTAAPRSPIADPAALEPRTTIDDSRTRALEFVFKGSPFEGMAAKRAASAPPSAPIAPRAPLPGKAPAIGRDYRWIQRMGQQLFGLKNDPGDRQLTGGNHSKGSEHYDRRAVDFGTARNSRKQLNAWLKWARAQGLDAIDEGDHIHVSLPGSGI